MDIVYPKVIDFDFEEPGPSAPSATCDLTEISSPTKWLVLGPSSCAYLHQILEMSGFRTGARSAVPVPERVLHHRAFLRLEARALVAAEVLGLSPLLLRRTTSQPKIHQ